MVSEVYWSSICSSSGLSLTDYITLYCRHTDLYEATIMFHGMLGEQPCRLTLKGEGSYDEKHEAIVNV